MNIAHIGSAILTTADTLSTCTGWVMNNIHAPKLIVEDPITIKPT